MTQTLSFFAEAQDLIPRGNVGGLEQLERRILYALFDTERTAAETARALDVSAQALSEPLRRLRNRKLISERETTRGNLLRLTANGEIAAVKAILGRA